MANKQRCVSGDDVCVDGTGQEINRHRQRGKEPTEAERGRERQKGRDRYRGREKNIDGARQMEKQTDRERKTATKTEIEQPGASTLHRLDRQRGTGEVRRGIYIQTEN